MNITPQIKEVIRNAILEMRQDNTDLNNQVESLFEKIEQTEEKQSVKKYHSSRFAFIKEGSYFRISMRTAENKNNIKQLYEKILKIFYTIQKRFNEQQKQINYAIYFRDSEGKMTRVAMDHIPIQTTRQATSALKTSGLVNKIQNSQNRDLHMLNINEHFESFVGALQATYKGPTLPSKSINMGHLVEAFERHFQNVDASVPPGEDFHKDPPWDFYQIWRAVRESKGNTPWFQAGDVGNTQVKFLGSGDVRLSSYDTLEDLLNFFKYLLDPTLQVDQKMVNNACKIFIEKELTDQAINKRLSKSVYKDVSKHVQNAIKQNYIRLGS